MGWSGRRRQVGEWQSTGDAVTQVDLVPVRCVGRPRIRHVAGRGGRIPTNSAGLQLIGIAKDGIPPLVQRSLDVVEVFAEVATNNFPRPIQIFQERNHYLCSSWRGLISKRSRPQ